jgi:hypothetical protein
VYPPALSSLDLLGFLPSRVNVLLDILERDHILRRIAERGIHPKIYEI